VTALPPESRQNGASVVVGSPRAANERKRRSAKLMVAFERREEAKSGLPVERSGRQC
jgi:hypothetical protein